MQISVPLTFQHDSLYVSGMTEHAQLDATMEGLLVLGALVADDTELAAATTVAASTTYTLDTPIECDPNFGRTVVVESTDAGDITLIGRDYLGQVMTETLTCIVGDVDSTKAFKYIDGYTTAADLAGDITIKTGTSVGMPFVISDVIAEYADGVPASAPAHTVADTTDPATAATGDPRGLINPTTALDGSTSIELQVRFDNTDTYGLYGVAQA